ncbi:MAG: MATE family efflux transporter [Erysipelotrichaceae bacterium]|uniref:MATE family efflux transporter n=1 Tax=Floccifex sp. TaxID=2815810 RepID=UPI002A750E97|nr:MATE family efflux transporter [Floccifex sp.]MDD7282027.1 MATE family efflux transporter [Erysipelotrichaceae bacterium]MDY2957862.1 MATE family efflux transporter [Floccifex sp.]
MPFLMIVATVGFMFGTGGSALVAKTLGEGNKKKANELFSLFVYVSFLLGIVFAIFSIAFIRPIAIGLGAKGLLLENCVTYGRIFLCALPFYVLQLLFQSFFVTAEKPQLGLFVTILAGITNMVLDAVLVMGLPQDYKLIGAALATATSQVVGGSIPLVYFFRKNSSTLCLGKTKWDLKAIGKACLNGSSEFMSNISMSVVGIIYNKQLMVYALENGVAAYGFMMYVSMIFSAAFIGYSVGTAPVIGFHFGAQNKNELKSILRKSLILIGCFSILMVFLSEISTIPLAKIFVGYDKELLELTVSGFHIFALSFLFMGFSIFGSSFFTALNDGLISALISFLRTLVFQILFVLVLPIIFGIDGIWFSIVIAEFMSLVLTFFFLKFKQKKYGY